MFKIDMYFTNSQNSTFTLKYLKQNKVQLIAINTIKVVKKSDSGKGAQIQNFKSCSINVFHIIIFNVNGHLMFKQLDMYLT